MKGWRFVFTRRWVGYLAVAVAFATACYFLGMWQLSRLAEVQAANTRIENNYDSRPTPIADVLQSLQSYRAGQEWTQVLLRGSYLTDDQLLVRNRPQAGTPGFEVLTPLRLADGSVFVVDRGWVPVGQKQDAPESVPAPPTGEVTVVARLQAGEPDLPGRSAPPAGSQQIATIQLHNVAKILGMPTYTSAYGLMVSESPAPAVRPAATLKPTRDEGLNLSYAIQWGAFGLFGFFGLGYAIRQEYRLVNSDDPQERERAEERARRRAAKPLTDAEAEDAILEASNQS